MKKFLFHPLLITLFTIIIIFLLPMLIPDSKVETLNDDTLRELALNDGLKSIPKSYKELLKVIDNPQNPLSQDKIALGKKLFFDNRLSKDQTINCGSCHLLNDGGDDNLPTAIGYGGRANPFHLNSPTVLNSALAKAEFWDGRAKDVEEQAGGPIQAPFEMNMIPKEVEKRLNSDLALVKEFKKVFGEKKITFENIKKAIGAYERTLLTRGAYDRFLDGNNSAISKKAKRGMTLFIKKGCMVCHSGMAVGGESIQRFPLRRYLDDYLGLQLSPNLTIKESPFPFENIGGFLGRDGRLLFRVPILRNITKTAPYFHNGSVKDLKEVVRIMSKYQLGDEFDEEDIDAVVEFLKTLEGQIVEYESKDL
jgi:cytochrome c peroxidase